MARFAIRNRELYNLIYLLIIFIVSLNNLSPFYLLAVNNESGGSLISYNVSVINSSDSSTDVYISSQSYVAKDTQLSIKMAKEVVCSIFPEDCEGKDFLITIYSKYQPELLGPSGGLAFSLAMIRSLKNLPDLKAGITGTINPGGVIGPVGGLDKKIEAAKDLDIILIPLGQKIYKDPFTNKTYNFSSYKNVYEVGNIFDAIQILWNIRLQDNFSLKVPEWYTKAMREIANDLCKGKVNPNIDYYSQASICFSENIKNKEILYKKLNLSDKIKKVEELDLRLKYLESLISTQFKEFEGINELQLYMILYDRLEDAKNVLKKNNISFKDVAYVEARLETIKEWMKLKNYLIKGSKINNQDLKKICEQNFEHSYQYYNYLIGLFPFYENYLYKDVELLNHYYFINNYALCILYSKKIQSKVSSMLIFTYLPENNFDKFFKSSLKMAEFYMKRNKEFPILSYSYYNYAKYLANYKNNTLSSIVYLQESINLAAMIYELDNKQKDKENLFNYGESYNNYNNKFNKETNYFVSLVIFSLFLLIYMTFLIIK